MVEPTNQLRMIHCSASHVLIMEHPVSNHLD